MERGDIAVHKPLTAIRVVYALIAVMGAIAAVLLIVSTPKTNALNKLITDCNTLEAQCASLDASYAQMSADIETYNGIYDKIETLKTQYFSNVRTLENMILNGESDVRIAYLTFDDGPFQSSGAYLDLLDSYGIRATFFVLKKQDMYDTYFREIMAGHTLGNHTATHDIQTIYTSAQSFMNSVDSLESYLYNTFHYRATIVRFPGGSSSAGGNRYAIINALHAQGYGYVDWTVSSGDGGRYLTDPQAACDYIMSHVGDDKIIVLLMHDYSTVSIRTLPLVIDQLQQKGFIFLPLFKDSCMIN